MRKTNKMLKEMCLREYNEYIFIRFSTHMIDRLIDRGIDEKYAMSIFNKILDKIPSIMSFIHDKDRPMRLEITDGCLWIGFTVDLIEEGLGCYGLCCRMIIKNPNRLEGKTTAVVIRV